MKYEHWALKGKKMAFSVEVIECIFNFLNLINVMIYIFLKKIGLSYTIVRYEWRAAYLTLLLHKSNFKIVFFLSLIPFFETDDTY